MLKVGSSAPTFDTSAVVAASVEELDWDQIHENKVLVLLFDSMMSDEHAIDDLMALGNAAADFDRLQSKVVIVSRDYAYDILERLAQCPDGGDRWSLAIPILVDSDDRIASLYDMVSDDGCTLWGHCIVDPFQIVRQVAQSNVRVELNIDELIRCVEAILRPDAGWPC